MNIQSAIKTAKTVVTANSPVLLVGTAIAGVVATGVLAAKGGYKARGIVDAAREEKGSEPTVQEKVQLTWLCYAAPAITGITTIASVVGVHTIHNKRHAAVAGLYAVASTKLDAYSEKAQELLGAKKGQELNNHVGQKLVDANPLTENTEILITDKGDELCYDDWSGRYFKGSVAIIESAVNEINRDLLTEGDASLNEFYEYLGLPPITMGTTFGWNGRDKVEIQLGSVTATDGRPAIAFWFRSKPEEVRVR